MSKNKLILNQLIKLKSHVEYYNEMSPFPIYDTEFLENLKMEIDDLQKAETNYDDEEVTFCTHCKSLFIEIDEDTGLNICGRCGSVNETTTLPNIYLYLQKYRNIWD